MKIIHIVLGPSTFTYSVFTQFISLVFQVLLCCLIVLALASLISAQRNNNRFRNNNRQNRQNNGNRGNNNNRNVANNNRNRQNAGRSQNTRQNNNRNQTPNRNPVINGGRFRATPANSRDRLGNEVYPGCNGTVCLPEARLCANRKQKRECVVFGIFSKFLF